MGFTSINEVRIFEYPLIPFFWTTNISIPYQFFQWQQLVIIQSAVLTIWGKKLKSDRPSNPKPRGKSSWCIFALRPSSLNLVLTVSILFWVPLAEEPSISKIQGGQMFRTHVSLVCDLGWNPGPRTWAEVGLAGFILNPRVSSWAFFFPQQSQPIIRQDLSRLHNQFSELSSYN